jgi:hypothetical protein
MGTMTETFILILIGMFMGFFGAIYSIRTIWQKIIGDKYIKESKKLQLLYNNIKREYGDLVEEPSDFISSAIGGMGIDGLLSELGINPSILNNPLVKGFIDKYAPTILEKIKSGDIKIKGVNAEQNEIPSQV